MAYLLHRLHPRRTRSSGGSDADTAATEPTIALEGAPNLRDLGEYRAADGLDEANRRFIREHGLERPRAGT